nr:hypothetical protein [uncultured bacterium]|tara:strand:- start:865 stop:1032 length:168 start_codon:yes stop_codon:yes gene_type:complete
MYQEQKNKRNKKVNKSSNNKITKKDKFNGILAIIFVVITAFLLYYFVLKGNIHKH